MVLGLGGHPKPRQCLFRPPARPGPHRGTPGASTHWQGSHTPCSLGQDLCRAFCSVLNQEGGGGSSLRQAPS